MFYCGNEGSQRFDSSDRQHVRLRLETGGDWRKGEDWNSFARMFSRDGKISEFGGADSEQPHARLWQ